MWNWISENGLSLIPFAVLLVAGIVLLVLYKKKASRAVLITAAVVSAAAVAVSLFMLFPTLENGRLEAEVDASSYTSPWLWTAILCVIGLAAIIPIIKKQTWSTPMLVTGALCIALSFILSCIKLIHLPQGGSITAVSMLPLVVFSWIYGPSAGVCAGVVYGILQLVQGVYIVHPVQLLVDYIFPFAALGTAGFFRNCNEKLLPAAAATAGAARFVMHFLSGFVFFAEYAPAGQAPWLYSFLYNGAYMLPETVLCAAVLLIPQVRKALTRLKRQSLAR